MTTLLSRSALCNTSLAAARQPALRLTLAARRGWRYHLLCPLTSLLQLQPKSRHHLHLQKSPQQQQQGSLEVERGQRSLEGSLGVPLPHPP